MNVNTTRKAYTVSLLTSSSRHWLADIPYIFQKDDGTRLVAPDALELYVFRPCDILDLRLERKPPEPRRPEPPRPETSLPAILKGYSNQDIVELGQNINRRAHDRMPFVTLTTYLPQVASADEIRADEAIAAMEKIIRLADAMGIGRVEIVGGRSDEECTRPPVMGKNGLSYDCQIVVSYDNYAPPWLFHQDVSGNIVNDADAISPKIWDRPEPKPNLDKANWLADGLKTVFKNLYKPKEKQNALSGHVEVLLEVEPGKLFILSRFSTVNHVLKKTADLMFPGTQERFVRFNADLGHLELISEGYLTPGEVWRAMFDGVGKPSTLIRNFHISNHIYRVHLDHPTTTDTEYTLDSDAVQKRLEKWLKCVICVARKRAAQSDDSKDRINISLELEAASRDELSQVGIAYMRRALERTERRVGRNDGWQHTCTECQGCPEMDGHALAVVGDTDQPL